MVERRSSPIYCNPSHPPPRPQHFDIACNAQNGTYPPAYDNRQSIFDTLALRVGQRKILTADSTDVISSTYRSYDLAYYPSKAAYDEDVASFPHFSADFCVAMVSLKPTPYSSSLLIGTYFLVIAIAAGWMFMRHTRSMLTVPLLSLMKQRRRMIALLDVFRA